MRAFFHPGLFTAHDIWHQVVRFYYYNQAINDGQFPPYWIGQLANHFGYPLFFFSYHLPWIIGIFLLRIGFDIPGAIKTLFFFSYFLSGITMYIFVNNLFKNRLSALLAAILYLYLPYHFLTIFVSASMGIAFVFIFLPLIFLGIHLLSEEKNIGISILAIGFAGIILSHIMHLVFLFPITILFLIFNLIKNKRRFNFLINLGFGLFLGSLIAAFYLLPAIYYNQDTRVHQETGFYDLYKRNFINFNQIVYSKWGVSPIVNNAKNGEISFQLGIAQWIALLALIILFLSNKITKPYRNLCICLFLSFTISIFLMLDFSKPVWEFSVKYLTVDFPFRLLLPATFIASICASLVLINVNKKLQIFVFILFIIVALYTNRNHMGINQYTNFPITTYLDLESERTTNTYNEYLPIKADAKLLNRPWNEAKGSFFNASDTMQTTNSLSFHINVTKKGVISTGQFYFPGQTLYLDQQKININLDQAGRVSLIAPEGTHEVVVKYKETPTIRASKLLSIIGIIFTSALFLQFVAPSRKNSVSN